MRISLHGLNKEILILIYVALSLTSLFHCLSHLLMSACHCLFYFIILFSPVIALLSAVTMPVTFPAGLFFHLLEALYDAFVKRSIIQWHLMFWCTETEFLVTGKDKTYKPSLCLQAVWSGLSLSVQIPADDNKKKTQLQLKSADVNSSKMRKSTTWSQIFAIFKETCRIRFNHQACMQCNKSKITSTGL